MLGGLVPGESESLHDKLIKIIVEDNNCKHEESRLRYKQLKKEKLLSITRFGLKEKKEMADVVGQSI
jgi:hypothetical protein